MTSLDFYLLLPTHLQIQSPCSTGSWRRRTQFSPQHSSLLPLRRANPHLQLRLSETNRSLLLSYIFIHIYFQFHKISKPAIIMYHSAFVTLNTFISKVEVFFWRFKQPSTGAVSGQAVEERFNEDIQLARCGSQQQGESDEPLLTLVSSGDQQIWLLPEMKGREGKRM